MKNTKETTITKKIDPSYRELLRYLAEGFSYYEAGEKIGIPGVKRTVQWKVRAIIEDVIQLANKGKLLAVDIELLSLANKRISDRISHIDQGKEMSEILEIKTRSALAAITPKKLKDSSAAQLMTIAAIAIDKGRLLSDQSTSNIAIKGTVDLSKLSSEELIEKLKKVREVNVQTNSEN